MKCVYCNGTDSRVIDSRQTDDGAAIRRRRECEGCGRRFTTYEKIDTVPLMVIKRDKRRQPFDSEKLQASIMKACGKRPVSVGTIEQLVREIEMRAYNTYEQEVQTTAIGEWVMDALKKMDEVAYVRFASVYRQFTDIQTFRDELNRLLGENGELMLGDHTGD